MEQYQLPNRYFKELAANPDLIGMGQNTNCLPTRPDVKAELISAIEEEAYHAYAPPAALSELRELILGDFGESAARLIYLVDPLNPLGICYSAAEIVPGTLR